MNLSWNEAECRFEAEFSADFEGDLNSVKAVGFHTSGPPSWIWYTYKAVSLNKLRENRPKSGLTISPEAREQFTSLWAVEQKNAEMKAQLAAHNKTLKKKLKIEEQKGNALVIPEKGYLDASDYPPTPPRSPSYIPPPPPTILCFICSSPVYFYEVQFPPTCLWCSKIVLDNATEVC
jgi:hypothetical protein